jgi:hypothetical protein
MRNSQNCLAEDSAKTAKTGDVVQFAQKHSPCHSEASFIGEESCLPPAVNSRFLARQARASE